MALEKWTQEALRWRSWLRPARAIEERPVGRYRASLGTLTALSGREEGPIGRENEHFGPGKLFPQPEENGLGSRCELFGFR